MFVNIYLLMVFVTARNIYLTELLCQLNVIEKKGFLNV